MSSPESFKPEIDAEKIVHPPAEARTPRRALRLVVTILINLLLLAIAAGLIWAMWYPAVVRSKFR